MKADQIPVESPCEIMSVSESYETSIEDMVN
jgi:hypothetical protein